MTCFLIFVAAFDDSVLSEYVLWEGCAVLGEGTSFFAEMTGAKFVLQQVLQVLIDMLSQSGDGRREC